MRREHAFCLALIGAATLAACSSSTAPKAKPRTDPYEVIYVVDDFPKPIDTLHVTFHLTDSSEALFDFQQSETLDTIPGHEATCFSLADTLGQRLVSLTAGTDTGVALQYQIKAFDPAAGVDTTGGWGLDTQHPWVWRWQVGDTVVTGFPRPASWPSNYCTF